MKERMTAAKFSVSIPAELACFLEVYQQTYDVSRSDAVARGLQKLRDAELAEAYKAHAEEWARDPDRDFWDRAAVNDGLGGVDDAEC